VRHDLASALVVAAVAASTATACGGKSASTTDAGVDGATMADGSTMVDGTAIADTGPAACDPYAQNCGAGMKCDFGCQGTTMVMACWPSSGGGAIGDACATAMSCAGGSACIAISTQGTSCRKYCTVDGDCATGERCHNDNVGLNCAGTVSSMLLHLCHP
jgi:hypothetical protein